MTIEANKRVLAEFDALRGADDLTPLDRLCRADMVNHAIAADRPTGLAGTREFLETMGRRQMTHEGWRELVVVAEGDYIVQYGVRHGRWHGGQFMGFDAAPGDYSRGFQPCTGSKTVRSQSVGPCATTSPCSGNSELSALTDSHISNHHHPRTPGELNVTVVADSDAE